MGTEQKKPLSEMTKAELYMLFPIFLTKHEDCWAEWFAEERASLEKCLPSDAKIHHIGSTSIDGIWAKPIVDILVEVSLCDFPLAMSAATECGYRCMHVEKMRMDFNKGYTEDGFMQRVFHLHIVSFGDNDELYFRDYMNENPSLAMEYEKLKLELWKKFEHDRGAYTDAKTEFVVKHTKAARARYGKRY